MNDLRRHVEAEHCEVSALGSFGNFLLWGHAWERSADSRLLADVRGHLGGNVRPLVELDVPPPDHAQNTLVTKGAGSFAHGVLELLTDLARVKHRLRELIHLPAVLRVVANLGDCG